MRWAETCSASGNRPQNERPLRQESPLRCKVQPPARSQQFVSGYLQIGFITSRASDAQKKIPPSVTRRSHASRPRGGRNPERTRELLMAIGARRSETDQNKWALRQPRVAGVAAPAQYYFGVHFADAEFLGRVDCDVFAPLHSVPRL